MTSPWQRREMIGDATLYLGDCLEILPTLGRVDAIVTDPPYGIGEAARRRAINGAPSKLAAEIDYGASDWDDKPLDQSFIDLMRDHSQWQVIFGGNFYDLPPSSCWLVWDKITPDNNAFADCELAWTNMPKAVRRLRYLWNGCMRRERDEPRVHPTQKPVGVMVWAIGHLPYDVETICDPCMGSGTTGVACVNTGKRFIGIERETKYFDAAYRRIAEAQRQGRLFDPPRQQPVQAQLFGGQR